MEEISEQYVRLAKKHGLNPVILKEIIRLHNMNYNNTEIAKKLGISRNTVSKYLEKIGKMKEEERMELIALILAMLGGAYAILKTAKYLKGR